MERLIVSCVTMNQSDFSKVAEMNIQSNVLYGNQAHATSYCSVKYNGYKAEMFTTQTRGVGINRNMALMMSDAEIILFSDDDMCYYTGYNDAVIKAFDENPKADILIFGLDYEKNGEIIRRKHNKKIKRLHFWNALKYGSVVIAVRRDKLMQKNIYFSRVFGGGCIFGSGEDSLFIIECLKKGMKIYAHTYVLGSCNKDMSTWFHGYNDKYFYDKGAWIACAFPKMKHIIKWYFIVKMSLYTKSNIGKILKNINFGINGYEELKPYNGDNICKI